ncbi:hypothetical protein [Streptacidiphilus carbonis]|uniref:hypothetical protein n=1 Tax=Streptacidiphilus carbonis TaxID=105422 RepID=UPI0005AAC172|nr:hypothetical protein [Streptacidiphilus carbonis]
MADSKSKGKQTIKSPGKKAVTFKKGALHKQLGVPADKPIPPGKMAAAQRGDFGPTAAKRANFAANVLGQGQKTAAANRSKKGK